MNSFHQIDLDLISSIEKGFYEFIDVLDKVEIKESLKIAMNKLSSEGNTYIQQLVHQEYDEKRLKAVLTLCVNVIRLLSAVFEPFIPSLSAKMNFLIGCDKRTPQDDQIYKLILEKSKE